VRDPLRRERETLLGVEGRSLKRQAVEDVCPDSIALNLHSLRLTPFCREGVMISPSETTKSCSLAGLSFERTWMSFL
jgi:hypothetical protein